MTVFLFLPRFVPPIAAGTKWQTIREKARCKPGDTMSLRRWASKPYRSPQIEILPPVKCAAVSSVWIGVVLMSPSLMVSIGGERVPGDQLDAFARADGFADAADMAAFYRERGVEDFVGFIHEWEALS